MAEFEDHTYARSFIRDRKESEWTRWFPGYTRPKHVGWYQVRADDTKYSARYWNGSAWMLCKGRNRERDMSAFQNWAWRGLKIKPETFSEN